MATSSVMKNKAGVSDVNTGIEKGDRQQLAKGLAKALAETYVLYVKTQGFHWNVVGPLFYGLHKMTEEQYEDMAAAIDKLAERMRAIGYPAPASLSEFVKLSELKDAAKIPDAETAIAALVADHETIARTFRETVKEADEVDDVVTADMLTARMQSHENMAWMLRSLIGK